MILSASRRTDIPAYYSDWLLHRIRERSVCVRNPINVRQVSRVSLEPAAVDCIVFWSKNPKPMLSKLRFLNEYAYYFQFTLNPYNNDIETNLPDKNDILETFKKLSDMIGPQRIIWRYDPVLINDTYGVSYHIDKFSEFAGKLKGWTEKVTFSFIDFYKKTMENIKAAGIEEITHEQKNSIAGSFSQIAKENNLLIDTCAEDIDLSKYSISHAKCIDDNLIAKITASGFTAEKDKTQRLECGCVKSIDIGAYNSCLNGCIYCYANCCKSIITSNTNRHSNSAPLLIGEIKDTDIVTERKMQAAFSV